MIAELSVTETTLKIHSLKHLFRYRTSCQLIAPDVSGQCERSKRLLDPSRWTMIGSGVFHFADQSAPESLIYPNELELNIKHVSTLHAIESCVEEID